jgi:hypothetical protein
VSMMSRRRSSTTFDAPSASLLCVLARLLLMVPSTRPDLAVVRAFAPPGGGKSYTSIGGDYLGYRHFVAPIVLQSRANGSQSRLVKPGLRSRGSRADP